MIRKLARVNWLGDKAVTAVSRNHLAGHIFRPGRHGHQRDTFEFRCSLHERHQGLTVNIGQPQIDQNQVRRVINRGLQPRFTLRNMSNLISFSF